MIQKSMKRMTPIGVLTTVAFLIQGCDWGGEPGDGGLKKSVEFHSTSFKETPAEKQADRREAFDEVDLPAVELVELDENGVADDESRRLDPLQEMAIEHVDDQPIDHLALARGWLEKRDPAAALVELKKAIYDNPQDYETVLLLGSTALRGKKPSLARQAFLLASEIDPDRADAWIHLGRIAIREKKLKQAADRARQALLANSQRAGAHNLMGRVWLAKSHWDRAILSFQKAVSLNQDSCYYRNNLGLAYLMKKNFDKAIEVLEELVGRDGVAAFMRNNLGLAYEGAGRLQEAISEFKAAVEQNPSYVNAQVNLDRLVTLAKRVEEKIEPIPAILEEPNDVAEDLIIVEPDGN